MLHHIETAFAIYNGIRCPFMMVIKIVICHPIWRMSPLNLKLASLKCKMLCPLHYSLLQIEHYYTLQCTLPHSTVHTTALYSAHFFTLECTVFNSTVHSTILYSTQFCTLECTILHYTNTLHPTAQHSMVLHSAHYHILQWTLYSKH